MVAASKTSESSPTTLQTTTHGLTPDNNGDNKQPVQHRIGTLATPAQSISIHPSPISSISPSPLPTPPADAPLSASLPPSYASISHDPARVINSHAEKQALRDARQRLDDLVDRDRRQMEMSRLPPESVDPKSSASQSNSGSASGSGSRGSHSSRAMPRGVNTTGEARSPRQLRSPSPASLHPNQDIQRSGASAHGAVPPVNENLQIGHRGYLPPGLDVKDALAKCEDPTLGWSLQFWVTIADPLTQHVFFACPASGQCSWDPPVGAFVVPRSPDGEWWELADSSRSNRSYYYSKSCHTLTDKTQWTRPGGNAFVIPLGLIQRNALPSRPPSRQSNTHSNAITPSMFESISLPREGSNMSQSNQTSPVKSPQNVTIPRPLYSPAQSFNSVTSPLPNASLIVPTTPSGAQGTFTSNTFPESPLSLPSTSPTKQRSALNASSTLPNLTPLSVVEEGSGSEADRSDNSGPSSVASGRNWWGKRRNKARGKKKREALDESGKGKSVLRSRSVERLGLAAAFADESPKSPLRTAILGGINSVLPKGLPLEPIYVERPGSVRTKRLSTGLHPLLPSELSSQIHSFQGDDFSRRYFATKRTGVFRTRVPVERIMEWQKTPITGPLLVLSKHLTKDAVRCFKVIQHVMGERERPVESAKPTLARSSSLANLRLKDNRTEAEISQRNFAGGDQESENGREEKVAVLEEIRWIIQVCVAQGEMRDEVYSQVIKQLTKNPDHDSVVLGFQLFCVFVSSFGPSKNFESFVKNFLERHLDEQADGISVMAQYCLSKIDILSTKGGRAKTLTVGEIEHASDAAFYPSVYGESLERIMDLQQASYPSLKVPMILPFLADAILTLGGMECEGIFRVPGDGDSVSELKSRMDRGHYQLANPHVVASLLKLWLRELEEPIIPSSIYNDALIASRSYTEVLEVAKRLPVYNKRVLIFVISFVQMFLREEVMKTTKMGPMNLALVVAPNILRTTSNSLVTVFTNSNFESRFVLQLLENMKPGEVDPMYIPVHGKESEW
nr:hypothetical protein L204_03741 [Cryptococcus depauperatus CBS 7855]